VNAAATLSLPNEAPLPATTEPLLSFAPAHVRRETLLQQAGIDSRSKDVLAVEVRVMASHFKGTPIISSVQYRANDEARRACAVAFIKNTTGLAMTCPKVPRYLVLRGAEFEAAIAQLTPEQRVWHDQLVEHSRSDFDSVRDNSPSDSVRADACEWLWKHLATGTGWGASSDAIAPLWPSPTLHATSWDVLLSHLGTSILRDKRPAPGTSDGEHTYTLRLQGANSLLTHVLACQLSSYALLRSELPEMTKEWQSLLSPARAASPSSISTDSSASSSEDDNGWEKARSNKRRLNPQRHARLLPQRVAAFQQKHFTGNVAGRFSSDTHLPLLALSTTLHIRAWEQKYTVCFVDNFASFGCDTRDLASDPIFQKLSTSIPGLSPPLAKWVVNPRNGGDTASIYVRDEDKDNAMPSSLNAKAKALLPGASGELKVDWRLWRTNTRGRIIYSLGSRKVCLNETVPAVRPMPSQSRPQAASGPTVAAAAATQVQQRSAAARLPPPTGSWAAVVQHSVKRLPNNNTFDHRPRKKAAGSSSSPASAVSPSHALQSLSGTPKSNPAGHPKASSAQLSQPNAQPDGGGISIPSGSRLPKAQPASESTVDPNMAGALQQLEARLIAMEQRMTTADVSGTLLRLTQNMDRLEAQQRGTAETIARIVQQQENTNESFNRVVHLHQQATTKALDTIMQQLAAMAQRTDSFMPLPPTTSMLPGPMAYAMGPYQNFMVPPMTMAAMQHTVLPAGAMTPPTPTTYATDPAMTAMQGSYPGTQHQSTWTEQPQHLLLQQPNAQPMAQYDSSLAAQRSATATPAHNGEAVHHG
jgi:hypothetical protein